MMQAGQHEATGNPIADSATGVLPREGEAPAEPACGTGLCGTGVSPVVRKYTGGLDLAGLNGATSRDREGAVLHGAGGIGGLLTAVQNETDDTISRVSPDGRQLEFPASDN